MSVQSNKRNLIRFPFDENFITTAAVEISWNSSWLKTTMKIKALFLMTLNWALVKKLFLWDFVFLYSFSFSFNPTIFQRYIGTNLLVISKWISIFRIMLYSFQLGEYPFSELCYLWSWDITDQLHLLKKGSILWQLWRYKILGKLQYFSAVTVYCV